MKNLMIIFGLIALVIVSLILADVIGVLKTKGKIKSAIPTSIINRFLSLWTESWGIPLAVVLWWFSPYVLHKIDPTSASYDTGVFQIIIFALISMLCANALSFLGLRLNFKFLFTYYVNGLREEFIYKITPIQRICVSLSVLFAYIFAFVLLMRIL